MALLGLGQGSAVWAASAGLSLEVQRVRTDYRVGCWLDFLPLLPKRLSWLLFTSPISALVFAPGSSLSGSQLEAPLVAIPCRQLPAFVAFITACNYLIYSSCLHLESKAHGDETKLPHNPSRAAPVHNSYRMPQEGRTTGSNSTPPPHHAHALRRCAEANCPL